MNNKRRNYKKRKNQLLKKTTNKEYETYIIYEQTLSCKKENKGVKEFIESLEGKDCKIEYGTYKILYDKDNPTSYTERKQYTREELKTEKHGKTKIKIFGEAKTSENQTIKEMTTWIKNVNDPKNWIHRDLGVWVRAIAHVYTQSTPTNTETTTQVQHLNKTWHHMEHTQTLGV